MKKTKSPMDELYGRIYGTPYKYPTATKGFKTVKGGKSEITKLKKRFRKKMLGYFGF